MLRGVRAGLLRWQMEGYPTFHRSRTNLLIHIVAVPAFQAAVVGLFWSLVNAAWLQAGVALALAVVAFGLQGFGHKREAEPPARFDGPGDAVSRILAEQFITFPRFVLSGGWFHALRSAS
jgi:uncharacterized membrane protein YGL010W